MIPLRKIKLDRGIAGPNELLIKRRLIAVRLNIRQRGAFRKTQVNVRGQKVVGMIVSKRIIPDIAIATYYRYSGVGAAAQSSEAFIKTLGSTVIRNRVGQVSMNVGAGQSAYVAMPVSLGVPVISYNGVEGGFKPATIVSVTNDTTLHTEDYYLFESVNQNLGQINLEIS